MTNTIRTGLTRINVYDNSYVYLRILGNSNLPLLSDEEVVGESTDPDYLKKYRFAEGKYLKNTPNATFQTIDDYKRELKID